MPEAFRTEKDSLGEVQVPAEALYGAQTQRAVENFPISGQRFGRRMIQALGTVKRAAAEANGALGLLDAGVAQAISDAAAEVAAGKWDAEFVVDVYQTGSGTSSNMNANEVVATLANRGRGETDSRVHPNDHVNFGQSSNDVIPTAIHVAARLAIVEETLPALEALAGALRRKAADFDDIVKSGRTHLMDATPLRLGQEFGGYATQVEKGVKRLRDGSEALAELALGGTAVGTGINTHPEFAARAIEGISRATGLAFREAEDHFEAQGARDALVEVHGALNTVAVSLTKIADDIRWLASGPTSGLAEIQLPAIQPGSSIMPGKVNPVLSEALMMVCARVFGNQTTVTVAGSRGNFELNVMMPVMAQALLESSSLLAGAVRAFTERCVEGITANEARARELLEKNPAIATALNLSIGYDAASEVAKQSAREGRSVRDVVLERGLLDEGKLDEALNVRGMTEPGLPGSPGPATPKT
ncbi:MAG: class II fumarate hydratase [Gemmatimonadales bacterium]|nr:MAG: class II fumarate hydratase [Gemmatimonadales bacterium]